MDKRTYSIRHIMSRDIPEGDIEYKHTDEIAKLLKVGRKT